MRQHQIPHSPQGQTLVLRQHSTPVFKAAAILLLTSVLFLHAYSVGQAQSGDIGPDRAKAIALNHAGLAESAISKMKIERDLDDGFVQYEVKFYSATAKYEYEIDGASGSIMEYDVDYYDRSGMRREGRPQDGMRHQGSDFPGTPAPAPRPGASTFIPEQEARAIALRQIGLSESDGRFIKVTTYDKHGRVIYDLMFLTDRAKYSVELDARSGEVVAVYHKGWHSNGFGAR